MSLAHSPSRVLLSVAPRNSVLMLVTLWMIQSAATAEEVSYYVPIVADVGLNRLLVRFAPCANMPIQKLATVSWNTVI